MSHTCRRGLLHCPFRFGGEPCQSLVDHAAGNGYRLLRLSSYLYLSTKKNKSTLQGEQRRNRDEEPMEYILFNSRDELVRLSIADIVYFEADGNYTKVITANKLTTVLGMNLGQMEAALAKQLGDTATMFIRLGKRFIINRNFIYKINVHSQSLILSDFHRFAFHVPASKEALKKMKLLLVPEPQPQR